MSDRSDDQNLQPPARFAAGGDPWLRVTIGESQASVFRSPDGTRYAKCVGSPGIVELSAERDRMAWLGERIALGPRFVDWYEDGAGACLLTCAVPGVPADQVSAADLRGAWDGIADAVRTLHEVPAAECPFRRDLGRMVALARDVVARDAVNPGFLPVEQQDTPVRELLARVLAELPKRQEQEAVDTVVCHGDLCLPNIVLDPETLGFAGFVDLGRLGLADRYADLALLLANARETSWPDEDAAGAADAAFAARYGVTLDDDRLRFYLHLDPLTWG
jgi:streptomycin 3"-kinase